MVNHVGALKMLCFMRRYVVPVEYSVYMCVFHLALCDDENKC
jgi:hypothetical protein